MSFHYDPSLIGKIFGSLIVRRPEFNSDLEDFYFCRCECGEWIIMSEEALYRGVVNACFTCLLGKNTSV